MWNPCHPGYRKIKVKRSTIRTIFIVVFLLPAILIQTLLLIYPSLRAFYISFFEWSGLSQEMTYVGLQNFTRMAQDPSMRVSVANNIYILIVPTLATLFISLVLAQTLNWVPFGGEFFKLLFFFPNLLSAVVWAIMWNFVYNPSFGAINTFLRLVGLGSLAKPWLGDPNFELAAIALVMIWGGVGWYVVLLSASIADIPKDLFEAAIMDGASRWQQFIHLTIPLVRGMIRISVIFLVINALQIFSLVFVIKGGFTDKYTEVISTYMFKQAFQFSNLGYGSAIAVFVFLLLLVLTAVALSFGRREPVQF